MGLPSDNEGESFTLAVPAETGSVSRVRQAIEEALRKWDRPALIDDATLIASELCTNAVIAMRRQRADVGGNRWADISPADLTEVSVWLYLRHDAFFICVRDMCDDAPLMAPEAELGESGRGLFLVDALASGWGHQPAPGGGKFVWAKIDVPGFATAGKANRE